MKVKREILNFVLFVLMLACVFVAFPPTEINAADVNNNGKISSAKLEIDKIMASAGETVNVDIKLTDNPGISSLVFKIHYDEAVLTLRDVKYNSSLGGQTIAPSADKGIATLYWVNGFANFNGNCVFATLMFEISASAKSNHSYDITVTYDPNDIYNISETNVDLEISEGKITIVDGVPGDINGDNMLNNKDVTRFMQYNTGWDVSVNELALDVNGDGKVNNKDVTRLMQYLADWNVEIYYNGQKKCDHVEIIDVITAPTCTEKGYVKHTCTSCGDSYVDGYVDAKGHSYTSVVTPPTETEKGYTTYTCSCGDTYKDNYVDPIPPAHVHAFGEWKEIKAPSCSEAGQKERVCGCGEKETEEIPKTEHNYTKYLKRPTCTAQGYTTYVCNCGSRYMGDYTPAKGHSYTSVVTPPTTSETGYTTHTCIECGYSYKDSFTDQIHAHSFGEWKETKASTCTDKGQKERACGCGEKETEDIAAKGHTEVTDGAVAPTCTATGLTEGKRCSVCDAVTVAQTVVAAKGHTEVTDVAKAPTCTETGLTEGKHCSVCNAVTVAQSTVPAAGHTYDDVYDSNCNVCGAVRDAQCAHTETTTITGTPATCTAGGLTDGKKCAKCGAVVEAQQTIPAKGHTEVIDSAKAPTCTESGLTEGKHCSVCGEVTVTQNVDPAKGHTEVTVPAKAATCTETGLTEGKRCSVCTTVIIAQQTVSARGHTEETIPAKAATCTETGLTEGKRCSVCGAVIAAQTQVPAKGHEEYVANTVAAETWKTGLKTYKCRNCTAHSREEVIPKVEGEMVYYEDFDSISASNSDSIFIALGWKQLYKAANVLPAGYKKAAWKPGASSVSTIKASLQSASGGGKELILTNPAGGVRSYIEILSEDYMSVAAKGDYTVQLDMRILSEAKTSKPAWCWASIAPRYGTSSYCQGSYYAVWKLYATGAGLHEANGMSNFIRCAYDSTITVATQAADKWWCDRIWGMTYSGSNTQLIDKTITVLIQVVRYDSDYHYIPTDAELGDTTSAIKGAAQSDAQALGFGYHIWVVNEQGQRILVSRYSPTSEHSGYPGILPSAENWKDFGDALAFIMEGVGTESVDYKIAIDNVAVWTGLGDMPKDKDFSDYEAKLNPHTAAIPEDTAESGVVLAKNDTAKIYAVLPSDTSSDAYRNALYAKDKLEFYLKDKLGNDNFSIPYGNGNGSAYELLIGDTGRAESKALKATLSGNQYAIKRDGNKIIVVATNDAFLYDAVEYLIENYFKKGVGCTVSDSKAVFSGDLDYKGTGDTTTVRYLLSTSGKTIGSTSSLVQTITRPDSTYHRNQGGCAGDNGYYYQCFIPTTEGNGKIAKVNLKTGATTYTDVLENVYHANDLTYDTKHDRFILANSVGNGNVLSILTPDLKKIDTVTLPHSIYSITYSPERNVYMVGCSNTRNMRLLDANFRMVNGEMYPVDSWIDEEKYTTQGIGSDENFVYCVLWKSGKNVITVFDWYGNHVGTIRITLKSGEIIEPESIDVDENGRILVVGGKRIWHITPTA